MCLSLTACWIQVRCSLRRWQIGSATALACIKMEVMQPAEEAPGEGQLVTTVEMTPMCSPYTRPGRPAPQAQASLHVT